MILLQRKPEIGCRRVLKLWISNQNIIWIITLFILKSRTFSKKYALGHFLRRYFALLISVKKIRQRWPGCGITRPAWVPKESTIKRMISQLFTKWQDFEFEEHKNGQKCDIRPCIIKYYQYFHILHVMTQFSLILVPRGTRFMK